MHSGGPEIDPDAIPAMLTEMVQGAHEIVFSVVPAAISKTRVRLLHALVGAGVSAAATVARPIQARQLCS